MIRKPASVIIAGPSGSGKSELVEQLLKEKTLFYLPPKKVAYCYDRWQPRFDLMKKHMQFYKGLPPQRGWIRSGRELWDYGSIKILREKEV